MNLAGLSVAVCRACIGVKPRLHEQSELLVQAEAGEDVHARRRVGAGHERHAGAEHGERHVELHLHELLAHRQGIGVHVLHDVAHEHGPGVVLPCGRRILRERIVAQVDVIDQPLPALPHERRHLPGLVLRHERDQGLGARGVVVLDVDARGSSDP